MGRIITGGNNLHYPTASLKGLSWTFGTQFAVVNKRSNVSGNTIMTINEETSACATLFDDTAFTGLSLYDGTTTSSCNTHALVGSNYGVGYTKASGTATPRFHLYDFGLNTWTHVNGNNSCVNPAANSALTIGAGTAAGGDAGDYEHFGWGLWQGLVMSDGEVERLIKTPDWARFGCDSYDMFYPGRDSGDVAYGLGRLPSQRPTRTGTSKGILKMPQGWPTAYAPRRRR